MKCLTIIPFYFYRPKIKYLSKKINMKKMCFKKKRIYLFQFIILLFFTGLSYGQKNINLIQGEIPLNLNEMNRTSVQQLKSTTSVKDLFLSIKGVYQIQVTEIGYKAMLSKPLYELIQNSRLKNDDVYLILDSKSTLYLPSFNKLESVNFKRLKSSIYKTK